MSRYSHYDTDEERLPEGMRRVGYDADSQRYTFVDENGQYYEGPEGARYGQLTPVNRDEARQGLLDSNFDEEDGTYRQYPRRVSGIDDGGQAFLRAQDRKAWQYMLPFFLICIVAMLLLFRFLNSGTNSGAPSQTLECIDGTMKYVIKKGDTCKDIATRYHIDVPDLMRLNQDNGMECNMLEIGKGMCVPGVESS